MSNRKIPIIPRIFENSEIHKTAKEYEVQIINNNPGVLKY